MAEPWTDDFAALGERSAQNLASLASTRALLHRPKESKMRFLLNRPLLAFALLLALVGVASGAAYAVERLWLDIDASKSAPEIQRDLTQQLEAAGYEATVSVEKPGTDTVEVHITSDDEVLGDLAHAFPTGRVIRMEVDDAVVPADKQKELAILVARTLARRATGSLAGEALRTAVLEALHDAGHPDVGVTIGEGSEVRLDVGGAEVPAERQPALQELVEGVLSRKVMPAGDELRAILLEVLSQAGYRDVAITIDAEAVTVAIPASYQGE